MENRARVQRKLISCLAYSLRLSSQLECETITPKLKCALQELVDVPRRKISLFDALSCPSWERASTKTHDMESTLLSLEVYSQTCAMPDGNTNL